MGMHAWQMIAHAASAAVDLRLGVRESLWLAGFLLSVSSAHPFKVIRVCALVRQSVSLCVCFVLVALHLCGSARV